MSNRSQASMIKQSSTIKKLLKDRIEKIGWSHKDIEAEAGKFGMDNVNSTTLSKYFSGSKNGLTEESIVFLCYRSGIAIALMIGTPIIDGGRLSFKIPKFDDQKALKATQKIFKKKRK